MRCNILFKDLSLLPPYSPSVKIRAVYYVGLCIVEIKAYMSCVSDLKSKSYFLKLSKVTDICKNIHFIYNSLLNFKAKNLYKFHLANSKKNF